MGAFVDSLFNILMSWVRALVSAIWALFGAERTTLLAFLGKHWMAIALVIMAAGLVLDWMIWLIRWQPYHIWAKRMRRLLRIADPEDEEDYDETAYMPPEEPVYAPEEPEELNEAEETWLPLRQPAVDEAEAQQVMEAAENAPDEYQYPGMRYDDANAKQPEREMGGTRRYAAVHAEGPGAAEVTRRRAEIDAWQLQMQEEARQKAEAERAARLEEAERARRAAQQAYEAEQARLAQEAYEAEQARLAKEAYEAEQARLAQEEYERQLAEYELQRAQYERDMAEYERQKAEYEAALARQALEEERLAQLAEQEEAERLAREAASQTAYETAEEIAPAAAARRRRRSTAYSDYVEGETVNELPAAPQWKPLEQAKPAQEKPEEKADKKSIWRSGVEKMAMMMEQEENEITGIASLPPRVDKSKAYKPAKKPVKK